MRRAAFASLHFADTARRSHAVLSFPVIANAIKTLIVSLGVNHLTAAMHSHMRVTGKGRWYKWRHLIENFFGKLKEYRGIATRCCKTDTSFSAFIAIAATVIRLH